MPALLASVFLTTALLAGAARAQSADAPDIVADSAADSAADTAPDTAPDTASDTAPDTAPMATLEVFAQPMAQTPYEQEMALITIRGVYDETIALEKLIQPEFDGLGWMMLGADDWFDESVDGRQRRVFERTMALFPQRAGRLEIGAFRHRLTMIGPGGTRFQRETVSAPFAIEARAKPDILGWWLPARRVTLTDDWDHPPDQLQYGQSARRTVTLEADGVGPEQLPPMPRIGSLSVLAFPDHEERGVKLTPRGPISTVIWRWTVKLLRPTGGRLEPLSVAWFDTEARKQREAVLPAQRIAVAQAGGAEAGPTLERRAWPLGLLLGLGLGALLTVPGLRLRSAAELAGLLGALAADPDRAALRRAARAGDAGAARAAAARLMRRRADGAAAPRDPALEAELARLDRALYAPADGAPPPDLRRFAAVALKRRR